MNHSANHEHMAAVARGDLARMSEIYQAWRRPLFRFFYRLSGKCPAAEDLVHEVFLRMLRFRATYQTERQPEDQNGIFEAWMYRIARNTFADYTRRHRLETDPGEAGLEEMWKAAVRRLSLLPPGARISRCCTARCVSCRSISVKY